MWKDIHFSIKKKYLIFEVNLESNETAFFIFQVSNYDQNRLNNVANSVHMKLTHTSRIYLTHRFYHFGLERT